MAFTLQILHASDLEGGIDAIEFAPNFAAIATALESEFDNTLILSAGDNVISGPFFNAASDPVTFNPLFEGAYNTLPIFDVDGDGVAAPLVDVSQIPEAIADTDGNGFLDLSEIDAFLTGADNTAGLTAADVFVTDINGDGFPDFFDEIDNFQGRIDISIMNVIGFDASALGNHEFDLGTDTLENFINYDSEEGNSLSSTGEASILAAFPDHVNYLQEVDWPGVQFPYLSANLDFTDDVEVGPLFTDEILLSTEFESDLLSARDNPADPFAEASDSNDSKIAPSTVIDEGGELIGVVGATTPLLDVISSPGLVGVLPESDAISELADILNAEIAELQAFDDGTGREVNKIVLVSHLQQFTFEALDLAPLLNGVDVIIAGGSDQIVADAEDVARGLQPDDSADDAFDVDQDPSNGVTLGYPFFTTNADGNAVAVVSTDGEYSYVGRLVVDFDEAGNVIPDSVDETVSGAFATTEAGVVALYNEGGTLTDEAALAAAFAEGTDAEAVQTLTSAVTGVVTSQDGNIPGTSDVFLNGARSSVRTEETNFGNLTADANLAIAKEVDPTVTVSLKNGGGIRDIIGFVGEVETGSGIIEELTTRANPAAGKEEGDVSQLDIANTLRFNNGLTLQTLTAEQLLEVLEHAVAGTFPGAEPGQFGQVGGLLFSFDPTATPREADPSTGEQVSAGERIQSVALVTPEGVIPFAENGELLADAPESIRIVTLDFLAGGGDNYPFEFFAELNPEFADVVQLEDVLTDPGSDAFDQFAAPGSEQDALAEYLADNFLETAFDAVDTDVADDLRIQNLSVREDTVLDITQFADDLANEVVGDADVDDLVIANGGADIAAGELGDDTIFGGDGDDILRGDANSRDTQDGTDGGDDLIFGGAGNDRIGGKTGNDTLFGELGDDTIWGDDGDDILNGGAGNDTLIGDNGSAGAGSDTFVLTVGEGTDTIVDFELGIDTLQVSGVSELGALTLSGSTIAFGGETLAVVEGVSTSTLTADSFEFVA